MLYAFIYHLSFEVVGNTLHQLSDGRNVFFCCLFHFVAKSLRLLSNPRGILAKIAIV